MGCLNSNQGFNHYFGNIHLSGPCNRSCYFCIGQHMMSLDPLNNLRDWPLKGIDEFIDKCIEKNVNEINITGTNTDPLLYQHTFELRKYLEKRIPNLVLGLRTNGVLFTQSEDIGLYNKGSITICSLNPDIYRKMMGSGSPPDIRAIAKLARKAGWNDIKVNIVLGPENFGDDLLETIKQISYAEIDVVNLREPYGQAHIGNPFANLKPDELTFGMPTYYIDGRTHATYWDVHYVEVESVNLYASGHISETYPITLGHDPVNGKVIDQSHFSHGRHQKQWLKVIK